MFFPLTVVALESAALSLLSEHIVPVEVHPYPVIEG